MRPVRWIRLVAVLAAAWPAAGRADDAPAGPALAREVAAAPPADPAAPPAPESPSPARPPLTQDLPGGVKFTPTGRLEADSVWVTQSPLNKAVVGDLQNTTGFRRARIGAKLEIADNVEWLSEFDFSNAQFRITNIYLGLIRLPVIGELRVGHFREPFGLEAQTSSNHITFMERGENNSLVPGREWGVAAFAPTFGGRGTVSTGVFRSGSDSFGRDSRDQNDLAVTTRATGLLWFDGAADAWRLVHLGGAYSVRRPPDRTVALSFQRGILEEGDSPLDPLLAAPVIPADLDQRFGVELAAARGRWSLQGEWTGMAVRQRGGRPVFYHGAYVAADVFLTGEHRGYDLRKGAFGGVAVRRPFGVGDSWRPRTWRGGGAWQAGVRYSYLDLTDPDQPPAAGGARAGGFLGKFTVGLNWYLNDHTRFMFNYCPAGLVHPTAGASRADLFSVRFAAFW